MKRVKLWTGVSSAILLGGTLAAGQALATDGNSQVPSAKPATGLMMLAEGGEGGEGGAPGAAPEGVLTKETLTAEASAELLADLRKGGYVLYFRHFDLAEGAAAEGPEALAGCADRKALSAEGIEKAKKLAENIKALGIGVGKVLASPACQALQSAELAFGTPELIEGLRIPNEAATEEIEMQMMRTALLPLLTGKPADGTNTVIIAQDENPASLGLPEPSTPGEALIFKPDGSGGYEREFQIRLDAWDALLKR